MFCFLFIVAMLIPPLHFVSPLPFGFIQWGPLFIYLFIMAINGCIRLIHWLWTSLHNRPEHKPPRFFRRSRAIGKAATHSVLIFILLLPAFAFPPVYKLPEPTGGYDVQSIHVTLLDSERSDPLTPVVGVARQVPVDIYYPVDARGNALDGTFPVVFYSHGAIGSGDSNRSTYEELVSNGYIVCAISHPGHSLLANAEGRMVFINLSYLNDYLVLSNAVDGQFTDQEVYDQMMVWVNVRVDDINFAINSIKSMTADAATDPVFRMIDTERIGLMGHSIGGSAMTIVARQRGDITAVVNLEGPLFSELASYTDGNVSWRSDNFPLPLLNIYSDQLWVPFQVDINTDGGEQAKQGFKYGANLRYVLNPPANVQNVYMEGARHLGLTDLPIYTPFFESVLDGEPQSANPTTSMAAENQIILEFFQNNLA
ncbi:MAG: hypothetical protein LBR39_06245 [Coriobacteriales bacterium]|jgi:acetyl esterase/lipase|nr:hypothetical protein [Coriobacteriales bacterium]